MSQQPEALRLVNSRQNAHLVSWQANACSELLRLQSLNTELLEVLKQIDKLPGISSANLYARAAIAKAEGRA